MLEHRASVSEDLIYHEHNLTYVIPGAVQPSGQRLLNIVAENQHGLAVLTDQK